MRATLSAPPPLDRICVSSLSRVERANQLDQAQSHVPRMLLVARRILGCEDLAWDAVQESLILLWHEDCAPHDLVGWLVRVVVNRSLHQSRSLRRRRAHEERSGGGPALDDQYSDPCGAAQARELAEHIAQCLTELPLSFRSVLAARDVEGLDYEQIAARLKLPVGTVRSRLHRARAMLRERLVERVHGAAQCWLCDLDSHR